MIVAFTFIFCEKLELNRSVTLVGESESMRVCEICMPNIWKIYWALLKKGCS